MKKKILIFSVGSAGREVYQLISSINKINETWEVVGYVDDDKSKVGKTIDDLNVYSTSSKPQNRDIYAICGIMDGSLRKKIFSKEIIKDDYKLTNLIHPSVEQPKSLKIGLGNIIFGNVHISFEVVIKNFSIISNYCDLGHNLIANNYFTIMPSVIIGGNCEIGEQTLIGSGAMIHQGVKIGSNCKIGMGTLITSEIKKNTSVVDYPRKTIKENN
jgi:sugar O-acyltransferase (sialic acid O-acetyltransferase NeuD family)